MSESLTFENPRARKAEQWVQDRISSLTALGYDNNPRSKFFSPELYLLERVVKFPFDQYPDYTAPWHLLKWPAMRWGYVFSIIALIENFRQVKGSFAGKPLKLEPFQILILICFLAPIDANTGHRLVRTVLLTIARKNAKSSITAALLTAAMALRPEKGGYYRQDLYVGASDREQASEIYDMCAGFITQDHTIGIADKFKCVPSGKTVQHLETLTKLKVLSSDAYRAHGRNAVAVVYDEIGNVPSTMASEFYNVLTSGFGAQEEASVMLLSTQAANDAHIFSEMVDRCKRVNSGIQVGAVWSDGEDDGSLDMAGFVFEVPATHENDKVDPYDEKFWYLANPGLLSPKGLGKTLLKDLRKQAKEAKQLPSLESKFRNRRLNQRANPYNPVISRSVWEANGSEFTLESLKGHRCWAGLDLSSVKDLTSLVLVFEMIEGVRPVIPYFWIPGAGLSAREREDKVPYKTWVKQGYLNAEAEKVIEYRLVAEALQQITDDYQLCGMGFDKWRIGDLQAALKDANLAYLYEDDPEEDFWFPIWQGARYFEAAIQVLERSLALEKLAHAGHPVLTWNASNAVAVVNPDGQRKFDKAKSYGRIDGIVALAMALRTEEIQNQKSEEAMGVMDDDFIM